MNKWNLYLVTSEELSKGRSTLEVVERAVAAGVDVVQLREKTKSGRELVELGKKIREITKKNNVTFIINDRIDVAYAVDADGVHLGQSDLDIKYARAILGNEKIVGLSVSNVEEGVAAEKAGADYIGAGAVFSTSSKADAASCFGLEGIKKISDNVNIPIVAIGGLNKENAAQVIKSGADCISLISAITYAEDIELATKEIKNIILNTKEML